MRKARARAARPQPDGSCDRSPSIPSCVDRARHVRRCYRRSRALRRIVGGSAPGVRVLATSREALRAEGEVVGRIGPLAAPAAGLELTAQEALKYPAVQLFVQRATASDLRFELSDRQAGVVGAICRELDGMALAIELAAGRVEAFGIQQVADQLATEFALTWPGRRTAAP